jgi:calcineurin-like phosphoesterase family protein
MATYFTADTHFGHGGARGLYRRPFSSVAAMDEAMEQHWTALILPEDDVWHLGDFAIGRSEDAMENLLSRLPGRKHLVIGNNDDARCVGLSGWSSTQHYAELEIDGHQLVLCHYAFRSWRNMGRGAVNLHGHSHGRLTPMPRQCDVGMDAWAFRPVTLPEIMASFRRRSRKF